MPAAGPSSESAASARPLLFRLRWPLAALALFALLAVLHTWPLATAPGTLSRNDNGDAVLHEWIMAWVAHQVITDPLHLFDANIFFPDRYTLAYSDHLFVQSLIGAPFLWAGASPVLVHNLVLIVGFALTGWTKSLVVRRWTDSRMAGLVSGSLVAFNAFSLTRLPQIQDLHLQFFPLALFALDRLLLSLRTRDAVKLAGWFVLQSLTGTYLMVFTACALVAAALSRAGEWIGPRFKPFALRGLLAAGIALVALAPFLLPYYFASRDVGLGRSLEEVQKYSAEWTDYLAAPSRLYFDRFGRRFFQGDALFPGIAALILAAIGAGGARRDARVRMMIAIAVATFTLSFGPAFPPYRWLYTLVPVLEGIRGAVRFGQITLAAIGILAGFGIAAIQRRFGARPLVGTALATLLFIVVHAEAARAPMGYTEYTGHAPIFESLDELDRNAVTAWFPFYPGAQVHLNARAMLISTRNFHRMLNGYSGYKPPSYYDHVARLANFPDEPSLQLLKELGVSAVLVDGRNMRALNMARLEQTPELSLWKTDGNLRIYLVRR